MTDRQTDRQKAQLFNRLTDTLKSETTNPIGRQRLGARDSYLKFIKPHLR